MIVGGSRLNPPSSWQQYLRFTCSLVLVAGKRWAASRCLLLLELWSLTTHARTNGLNNIFAKC